MKKICHIIYLDKFSKPFYQFIKDNFENADHQFITYGEVESDYKADFSQYHLTSNYIDYLKVIPSLLLSDKIILHGAFSTKLLAFFMLQPWLLLKTSWVIWGKDLQFFVHTSRGVAYQIRRFVLSKVNSYITYLPEDYEKAKLLLNSNSSFKECIAYPSNIVDKVESIERIENRFSVVLVGNSADPSNCHKEVFEKLKKEIHRISKIIVPLSYGDKEYAVKVVEEGKAMFGDKFEPITKMLPINDYREILKSVDFACFNHNRQQAMGNIIFLLSLGKTVYLKPDTPSWLFFLSKGVLLKSVEKLDLKYLDDTDAVNNKLSIENYFNRRNLKNQWEAIFNE